MPASIILACEMEENTHREMLTLSLTSGNPQRAPFIYNYHGKASLTKPELCVGGVADCTRDTVFGKSTDVELMTASPLWPGKKGR